MKHGRLGNIQINETRQKLLEDIGFTWGERLDEVCMRRYKELRSTSVFLEIPRSHTGMLVNLACGSTGNDKTFSEKCFGWQNAKSLRPLFQTTMEHGRQKIQKPAIVSLAPGAIDALLQEAGGRESLAV